MNTTTHASPHPQPPEGTGFGLRQQADTAAADYVDNVGRHARRSLPGEKELQDRMREKQNKVNKHVRANSIFSVLVDCVKSSKHADAKIQVQSGAVIQLYNRNFKKIQEVAFPGSIKKKRKRKMLP